MADDLLKFRPTPEESKWKIEQREIVLESKWNRYVHDSGKTDHGSDFDYYYVQINHSVGVVAMTKGKVILVRQYRYPTARVSLEVPGGTAEKKEKPELIAKRELVEETGYEAKSFIRLGEIDVANGYSSDIAQVYLASNCEKIQEPELESSEEGMTVELYPVEEVYEMIQAGKITDSFTLAAFMLAFPHIL